MTEQCLKLGAQLLQWPINWISILHAKAADASGVLLLLCLLLNPNLHFFSVRLQNITVLVYPSENVKEVENITFTCSTCTLRDSPGKSPSGEIILPSVNGNFILCSVTKNYTGINILHIFSKVGTISQRLRELL